LQRQWHDACAAGLGRPEHDGEGVGPVVVEDALGDGERCLRADVGDVAAEFCFFFSHLLVWGGGGVVVGLWVGAVEAV
jgi:hypothetical protein